MAIPPWLVSEIGNLVQQAQEQGERLVQATETALNLLEKHGFLYKAQMHCKHVGCHPKNRDGSGINIVDVHNLIDNIVASGFVLNRVSSLGVEVLEASEVNWNMKLVEQAGGKLGEMDGNLIKVLSLQGSHTNMAFRMIFQGASHGNVKITSNGKLSLENLRHHDEAFAHAVENGVTWKILSADVARQLPGFLGLVQRHGNQMLMNPEHEMQLMRRVHAFWQEEHKKGQPVEYSKIQKRVCNLQSSHQKALPHIYTFALKAAGGSDPWLLEETEQFVRTHSSANASLGAALWQSLCADVKGPSQHLRFRHGMATWLF